MSLSEKTVKCIADQLFHAFTFKKPISRISAGNPEITVVDAYSIQTMLIRNMVEGGYNLSGKKIGITSKAMQEQVGIDEPDYGILFHELFIQNEGEAKSSDFIIPRVEAEIMFKLEKDLTGGNITSEQVAKATRYVVAALEIIDNRYSIEDQTVCDSIADNAALGAYVIGDVPFKIKDVDLKQVGFVLEKNGKQITTGTGAAVMGDPVNAVVWLANKMCELGNPLRAGELILSGSMIAAEPAAKGDYFRGRFGGMGDVCVHFV